ncbi:MAG: hypothetical protein V6Z82_02480 [Flavobacteriales bacterium]
MLNSKEKYPYKTVWVIGGRGKVVLKMRLSVFTVWLCALKMGKPRRDLKRRLMGL